LIASCWFLAISSGILLFLRTYCKVWRSRGLWFDDHLLLASWVALAIAVSVNTYIVSLGFGSHIETISDENLKKISLSTIMVAAFGIMSTTLSKSSFAITLYRISMDQWMKYLLIFIMVTINISMNLVWIFGLVKCSPFAKVLDGKVEGTCWDKNKLVKFQLFAAYYSAALDFVLALLPWQILMGMSLRRRERLGVTVAMSLGAIAGATAIVKAVMVVNITSKDFTYDRVDLTIWTLAEPAVSIMAISIPVLYVSTKPLLPTHLTRPDACCTANSSPATRATFETSPRQPAPRASPVEPLIRQPTSENRNDTTATESTARIQSSSCPLRDGKSRKRHSRIHRARVAPARHRYPTAL
jgi:hypothetical protein